MARLAEEVVEEWLNRQGYFTIRGAKVGVHEIDLLAIRQSDSGIERRHIEVQASSNPMSYFSKVPREVRLATGRAGNNAKQRSEQELVSGVGEWVHTKFLLPEKEALRQELSPGQWSFELAVHKLKYPRELEMISSHGVVIHRLEDIVRELSTDHFRIAKAAGADLVELVLLGSDD